MPDQAGCSRSSIRESLAQEGPNCLDHGGNRPPPTRGNWGVPNGGYESGPGAIYNPWIELFIRRLLPRLGLSGLSLVLGLVVAEGLLAGLGSYPSRPRTTRLEADGRGLVTIDVRGGDGTINEVTLTRVPSGDTRRVVMVGDGTFDGHRIRERSTIALFLERRLRERLGGKWEVVNLGAPGLSSGEVREVAELAIDELAPEFLLVHVGHDEFLPVHVAPLLDESRHPVLWRLLAPWQFLRLGRGVRRALLDVPRNEHSRRILSDPTVIRESSRLEEVRQAVLENYEHQLFELCEEARLAHVQLVLVEPSSNSREFGPLVSATSRPLLTRELGIYRRELERVEEFIESGKLAAAQKRLAGLVELDPNVAQLLHLQARLAWQEGELVKARRLERRALGFDEFPQAASEALIMRLHAVADVEQLECSSLSTELERPLLPGEPPIFIDHVHPSTYGQFLLACHLAALIDPERDHSLEPYSEQLEQRLADYHRICQRLGITPGSTRVEEMAGLQGLIERAAVGQGSANTKEWARRIVDDLSPELKASQEVAGALLVLALLTGDRLEAVRLEQELQALSIEEYQRLVSRLLEHPRLRGLLLAARE